MIGAGAGGLDAQALASAFGSDNQEGEILVPPSLRSAVENRICQAIVTGDLPPATHLPNRMMCDRFGVSRTVVREAIRLLEAELFEGWAGVEVDGRRAKG